MKKTLLLTAVASCALLLAGCGEDEAPKQAQPAAPAPAAAPGLDTPIGFNSNTIEDVNEKLLEAIRTKPVEGGQLIPRPGVVYFDLEEGGRAQEPVRIVNEGDADVTIKSLVPTTQQKGLDLSGPCTKLPTIAPGQACDLTVAYEDLTGRSLDTGILMTTDSQRTPQVTIELNINVSPKEPAEEPAPTEEEPAPAIVPPILQQPVQPAGQPPGQLPAQPQGPQVSATGPSAPARPTYNRAHMEALAQARAARQGESFGGYTGLRPMPARGPAPQVSMRTMDERYDPTAIPWTESSLPVDRARILTSDRVVKAVVETPVTNVMCNQVVAVVESHVYAPDNVNVLIPKGTRAIGRCQGFADERVNITWERMITPRGVNISFRQLMADTGDASGRGGVPGRIEQRFTDPYILPIVSTSVDVLSSVARALYGKDQTKTYDAQTGRETTTTSATDQAINDFNDTAREEIKRYIQDIQDVRKLVVIPGGSRIDIVLQEDIYFKSPHEVVRLADVEYDLKRPVQGPAMFEQSPPTYALQPQMGGPGGPGTIMLNGRAYLLQPMAAPVEEGAGARQQRSMMVPGQAAAPGALPGAYQGAPAGYPSDPGYAPMGAYGGNYAAPGAVQPPASVQTRPR